MTQLVHLSAQGCTRLAALPSKLSQLTQLSSLDLAGCSGLNALPCSVAQLMQLAQLELSWCTGLTALPDSVGQLRQLTWLDLHACERITELPNILIQLLQRLRLGISFCLKFSTPAVHVRSKAPPTCRVFFSDVKFARDYSIQRGNAGELLHKFQSQLRKVIAMQSLLGDRNVQRASLDGLAVVAALLAGVANAAFGPIIGSLNAMEEIKAEEGSAFDVH